MGQEISMDDYESDSSLQSILQYQVQGDVEKIQIEHLAEKWILRACVAERRAAPYGRLRSECGEPLIQKREEKHIINNLKYCDGFPVPSTTDDLNTFDEEVFESCTRTVEVPLKPKNQRALSIPNLSHIKSKLSSFQLPSKLHFQAPSKPKFLDKLFTNVGLSKKLQGRTRNGLVIQTVTTGTADSENSEDDPTIPLDRDLLRSVSEPQTEVSSPCEETILEKTTQSTPNSPKLCGIVKRRLLEYQEIGTRTRETRLRSSSTPSSPSFKRRGFVYPNPQTFFNSKGENSLSVLCSGLSRNEQFRQTVMSKGYVKAVVDQIDHPHSANQNEEKPNNSKSTDLECAKLEEDKNILEIPNVKPSDVVRNQNSTRQSKKDTEKSVKSPPPVHKKPPKPSLSDHSNCSSGTNSPVLSPATKKHVFNSNRCSGSSHKSNSSDNEPVTSSPRTSRKNKEIVPEEVGDTYENVNITESKSDISNSVKSLSSGCYSNGVSSVEQETGREEGETADDGPKIGLDPAKLFDSSWSDSDVGSFSDFDSDLEEEHPVKEDPSCVGQCKIQKIATELLQTETAYTARLQLLDEIFQRKLREENEVQKFLPPDIIPQIFSNITSIHHFHKDFLLPQLQKRMEDWDAQPRIGDLMKTNAPFLKLYTEYVRNFDHAMNLINTWMEKSPKFSSLIKDIQTYPECGKLTLQHHMLEPIQRIPRYQLLLKDYTKHLPEDSPDSQDAKTALEKVEIAAKHSEEAMRKIEKFHKLLEIKEKVATTIDLISPTRELVREGKIKKISARGGERLDRYLFLFNDLLLICGELLLGSHKLKAELKIDETEILEGENIDIPNTFYVKSRHKIIQFLDENPGEENSWCESIKNVIKEFRIRKPSMRRADLPPCNGGEVPESDIGNVAPHWIKDDEVSMCQLCSKSFTALKRRHHCRACGRVVCGKCSSKKSNLAYDNNRPNRVCDKCFSILKNVDGKEINEKTPKGVLKMNANDPAILSGYLHKSVDRGKTWTRRWFVVTKEFAMYEFKAHQDIYAISTLPLPGYQVIFPVDNMENVFILCHQQKIPPTYLQSECANSLDRWVNVLKKMVNLELPEELNRNSTHSTESSGSLTADDTGEKTKS
ncbi:FYVE, RhoGEF and PH domain-containing protein 4-like isoform X4 [Ostrea edulis]|uniref:FYVE, RhoGEF and PH domain-containing protein 4-like isoform X4 n=1 Tax=Ostrea edulis TaxID=37623 RepID=UPI0024AF6100|nr:FYVE, RhoGEF and PH domain-containing protein 4-like isoform X4 [Ostrea edulis]